MKEVAEELTGEWIGARTSIHFVREYYDSWPADAVEQLTGLKEVDEGLHDEYSVTAIIMTVDPDKVHYEQRVKAGKASINGISIIPAEKTVANGEKLVAILANRTVEAIRRAINGSNSN